jgi:hypothetical protein
MIASRWLRGGWFLRALASGLLSYGALEGREDFFSGDVRLLKPWFTGPLIAPAPNAVPKGVRVIQPYGYWLHRYGFYDKTGQLVERPALNTYLIQTGLASSIGSRADIQVVPAFIYNTSENKHSAHFADLPVGMDIQLYSPLRGDPWPSVKFGFREIIPTGKYDELSPGLLGTDISGTGCYTSITGLVFRKLWFPEGPHYLSSILSCRGIWFSSTAVKGLSLYGGAENTNGTIRPGTACQTVLSFEYSLTDNWALALDNVFVFAGKDHFKGFAGTKADGEPATVGYPPSKSLSFAPAIEYNFRLGFGVIAGCWFTVWGRNSRAFTSAVVSVVYAF